MFSRVVFKFTIFLLWVLFQTEAQLEEWKIPCGAEYRPKNCENISLEALETVEDYERCAPMLLAPFARDYIWHGSGMEITMFENKAAYSKIRIKKRVLRGLWNNYLETTVMGGTISFPVGISPTIGLRSVHPEGAIAMARGASKAGVVMILDSLVLTSLEDVAAAVPPETQLWMQTYMNRQDTMPLVVRRAEKAGYKAIVVTVDQPFAEDTRCHGRTTLFSQLNPGGKYPNLNGNKTSVDATVTFDDLKWLINMTKLPVIAKGILTKEDALQAIEVGVSAIFVSNQGGRELDGCLPTIHALPDIVDAVNSVNPKIDVYVDGGVRSGYDVFKALAAGAKAAFIGRPALWGLTIGGDKGVEKLLSIMKEEFRVAMVHAGFLNPSQITRSSLLFPTCGYYYSGHITGSE